MPQRPPNTEELVDRAAGGDAAARQQLLARHRARLRRMVAVRLDRRLAARVDPSDVVQESLAEAARTLDAYLRDRPLPFYPWLRQFAWGGWPSSLATTSPPEAERHPRGALGLPLPDRSAVALAERLVASGTSPSRHLMRRSCATGSGRPWRRWPRAIARSWSCGTWRGCRRPRSPRRWGSPRGRSRRGTCGPWSGSATCWETSRRRNGDEATADHARASSPGPDDGDESIFEDLVEELTDRLQAGEAVDLEAFLARHPEHAERLRRLDAGAGADGRPGPVGRSARSTGVGPPPADPAAGLGELGDFRLLREIGRGGMGVVYEAEQLSLGRRVALKVLPFAAALDPRQLQRFQVEAQAAACLHHPHIVPVHAVGCERGVHYYAMQFIEGRSLAAMIAELRRLDGLDPADGPAADLAAVSTIGPGRPAALRRRRPVGPTRAGSDAPTVALARGRLAAPGRDARSAPGRPHRHRSGSSTRNRDYVRTVARLGCRPPRRWTTPMPAASSTATSSRPTCCSTPRAGSGSPTSAWRRSGATTG